MRGAADVVEVWLSNHKQNICIPSQMVLQIFYSVLLKNLKYLLTIETRSTFENSTSRSCFNTAARTCNYNNLINYKLLYKREKTLLINRLI